MLLSLPLHLPLLLSQLLPLPVNPTVSVVTPVAANTAFYLNCLSHFHLYILVLMSLLQYNFTKQSTATSAAFKHSFIQS